MAKSQDSTQSNEPTTNEQVIDLLKRNKWYLSKENAPAVDQIIALMNKDDFAPSGLMIRDVMLKKDFPIVSFILDRGNKKLFDAVIAKKPNLENGELSKIFDNFYFNSQAYQLKKLITEGYFNQYKDNNGNNILAIVLKKADLFEEKDFIDVLKYLLEKNISINDVNTEGTPAFHYLYNIKNEEVIKTVLTKKSPDFSKSETFLHKIIKSNNVTLLKYLIDNKIKIDINKKNDDDITPLQIAIKKGYVEIFNLLVSSQKPDFSLLYKNNNTLLHVCAKGSGSVQILEYLLKHSGIDLNARNNDGSTPLMLAAAENNYGAFRLLLKSGADITLKDNDDHTLMHYAAYSGNVELLKYVLDNYKLDINARDKDESTPLMVGAKEEHFKFMNLLIANGAKTDEKNNKGENIFDILKNYRGQIEYFQKNNKFNEAVREIDYDDYKYIQNLPANQKTFLQMVQDGDLDSIEDDGFSNKPRLYHDYPPLVWAVMNNEFEAFKLLLEKKEYTKITHIVNSENKNLMHYAAIGGNVEIIKILIAKGIKVDSEDKYGYTPVMCAAEYGKLEALKVLVENGANIKAVSNKNENLLHFALSDPNKINIEMVKYLVEQGVDVNLIADSGKIPLEMAAGRQDVMDILKSASSQLPANDKTAELPKQDVSSDYNSHPQQSVIAPQSNSDTTEPQDASKDTKNPSIEVKISGMSIFKNILISTVITTIVTIIAAAILFEAAAPFWILAPVAVVTFAASCIGMSYFKSNLSADEKAKPNLNQSKASPANSQSAANEKSFRKDQDVSQQQAQNNSKNIV